MINVNLLPPDIKDDIKQSKDNSRSLRLVMRILLLGLLLIAMVVGMHLFFKDQLNAVNKKAATQESSSKNFGSLETEARKTAERINAITNISKNVYVWSGTIEEIQNIMPSGVYITSFKYDTSVKNGRGQISGQANTQKDVSALRDSMEQSKKFAYVDIDKSQTQLDPTTKKEGQAFIISFALEKDALK